MAIVEQYNSPVLVRYKASVCTKATFFNIIVFLFMIVPPFLLAYRSEGFWIKEAFYREQPEVHFKHEMMLVIRTSDPASYLTWSTFPNFNLLEQEHLRIPLVKTRDEDVNRDGRPDKLYFNIEVPAADSEVIVSVQILLFFDYKLHRFTKLSMEAMAVIEYSSPISGAQLTIEGDLCLKLRQPLAHTGTDTRYNVSIINKDSMFAEEYTLSRIYKEYLSRNVTTRFECEYASWIPVRGAGRPFVLQGSVTYPEEIIVYIPGFWQTIKQGWVQYLSVLVIFIFLAEKVKTFVYENQVVTTMVEVPYSSKNHYM